jgi:hypothetical protein
MASSAAHHDDAMWVTSIKIGMYSMFVIAFVLVMVIVMLH